MLDEQPDELDRELQQKGFWLVLLGGGLLLGAYLWVRLTAAVPPWVAQEQEAGATAPRPADSTHAADPRKQGGSRD
jgi:hypothetical protein